MTYLAKITLHWLINISDGQSPRGPRFVTPAKFDHQSDDWTADAWSLVISPEGSPDIEGIQKADAKFLMPSAPQEWLTIGKRFTLFEGRLALAEGIVERVAATTEENMT